MGNADPQSPSVVHAEPQSWKHRTGCIFAFTVGHGVAAADHRVSADDLGVEEDDVVSRAPCRRRSSSRPLGSVPSLFLSSSCVFVEKECLFLEEDNLFVEEDGIFIEKESRCVEENGLVRQDPRRCRRAPAGRSFAPFVLSATDGFCSRAKDVSVERKSVSSSTAAGCLC
jgi:hypothetical protein